MELLFKVNEIIQWGGFLIIIFLVFAETGLLLGLVLPGGETLVFTAGLLVSTGTLNTSLLILLMSLIMAGIAGDACGYWIGRKIGRKLYSKKDTWYFKKRFLHGAESYLQKHRKGALFFGKFLPVVRPFVPMISGTTRMSFHYFLPVTALACVVYIGSFAILGYFLGTQFPVIREYIGWIVPVSILITVFIAFRQIKKLKTQ